MFHPRRPISRAGGVRVSSPDGHGGVHQAESVLAASSAAVPPPRGDDLPRESTAAASLREAGGCAAFLARALESVESDSIEQCCRSQSSIVGEPTTRALASLSSVTHTRGITSAEETDRRDVTPARIGDEGGLSRHNRSGATHHVAVRFPYLFL